MRGGREREESDMRGERDESDERGERDSDEEDEWFERRRNQFLKGNLSLEQWIHSFIHLQKKNILLNYFQL